MVIIAGASGHAKEVFELLSPESEYLIYDDVSVVLNPFFDASKWLKSESELLSYNGFAAIIAVGQPNGRRILFEKMSKNGLLVRSIIAPSAIISTHDTIIGDGANIMNQVFIGPSVRLGQCVLVNAMTSVHHDVIIDDFVEIAPHCAILGNASIGSMASIGSHATILPGVRVGAHAVVGAGSVVTKDVADHATVVGIPARVIKMGG